MHIAVIGTGYVGLVTGACFAEFGVDVICVDVDAGKIERLIAGEMPIYEPGLERLVSKNAHAGRLRFTTDVRQAIEQALVIFLAVGTPPKTDGSPDLSFVEAAACSVADHMNGYKVIVTKSTVPIGTGEHIRKLISQRQKSRVNFGVVSNPEFLREGAAISDFMRPDRVVIGSRDEEAIAIMKDLYRPLYLIEAPFVITSLEAAELTKYAANAFLATKVSFINEIANLCERIGCDVHDVARAIGMDKRIGSKFLQRREMLAKIEKLVGSLDGKGVAVLGLAFKPETDDMREAPAVDIIRSLVESGATVRAYDPVAMTEAARILPDIKYAEDEYAAVDGAEVLVFVTEWNQFRALDMTRIRDLMKVPRIADLRNIYEPSDMRDLGFEYVGVGR